MRTSSAPLILRSKLLQDVYRGIRVSRDTFLLLVRSMRGAIASTSCAEGLDNRRPTSYQVTESKNNCFRMPILYYSSLNVVFLSRSRPSIYLISIGSDGGWDPCHPPAATDTKPIIERGVKRASHVDLPGETSPLHRVPTFCSPQRHAPLPRHAVSQR